MYKISYFSHIIMPSQLVLAFVWIDSTSEQIGEKLINLQNLNFFYCFNHFAEIRKETTLVGVCHTGYNLLYC
jgi:hypothetical protein